MQEPWRFIAHQEFDAVTNMAIDEAILNAHLEGAVPPTLRLYGFNPPAISIGHTQNISEDFRQRAKTRKFDLVRRPTGGRAVLHQNELTYSFVGTSSEAENGFLSPSILEAYKQICQGLQNAFFLIGVDLELGGTQVPYKHVHDCFLATTGSDLHYKGKKIAGSAQLRRKNAVLQHGSVLLNQDQTSLSEVIGLESQNTTNGRHANLFDVLGRAVSISEFEDIFKRGFGQAFQVSLKPECLSEQELKEVAKLQLKYQHI